MRKMGLVVGALTLFLVSFAQEDRTRVRSFNAHNGKFLVYRFAENIYKVKYEPYGYKKGELVSDAVIMKPSNSGLSSFAVRVSGDSLFIKGRLVITGTHQTGEYRGFYFTLGNNEMIFGAGERALPLNRRGSRLNLYNNPWYGYGEGADNLNYSVPFVTSSSGYGLFFDNPSKGYLDIGKTNKDTLEYGASSGELNVFIIFGDYKEVLQSYFRLTGTQPLPPRWALGNFMSRFGYTSEKQVEEIYSKMQDEGIPVDAIIFDLFWFGDSIKYTLGNLDWVNKNAWPDPKKMIASFRQQGVNTILVTEPFFVETSTNYKASKPYLAVDSIGRPYYLSDFYFGHAGLVDIFRSDAQHWFWQFYKKQMLNGVESWWGDLGEPEKHPSNLYHRVAGQDRNRLFGADEVHNLYGHTWTKMLFTAYAKEYPNKRLFSLNRSGFAGSQRYSIFPWTGDVGRNWSGFRAQLPILLGMSMSGVPYVHSDAGGFGGGEGDAELYVRWLQFAALTPIFRPHGTAVYEKDPQAFSFPSEPALFDEPFKGLAKEAVEMRYALLPYNYSLAYEQAANAQPLMVPLYYYYPTDTACANISDEYFWGENMLVAPVLEKGAMTRKIYLPEGSWYELAKDRFITGSKWITDSVSMSGIPVFLREGGFVPTLENTGSRNTSRLKMDSLSLLYTISNKPTSYELYDDDGTTKGNIQKKQFELIEFLSSGKQAERLELTVSGRGTYAGKPLKRHIRFLIPNSEGKPKQVFVNGKELEIGDSLLTAGENDCACNDHLISFQLNYTGKPVKIEIRW